MLIAVLTVGDYVNNILTISCEKQSDQRQQQPSCRCHHLQYPQQHNNQLQRRAKSSQLGLVCQVLHVLSHVKQFTLLTTSVECVFYSNKISFKYIVRINIKILYLYIDTCSRILLLIIINHKLCSMLSILNKIPLQKNG